jgi:hypothetical protein
VDVPAALSTIEGTGTAKIGASPPVPLDVGMDLPVGTQVCIEAASHATIRLAYDPVTFRHDDVQLSPGTCLVIAATSVVKGARSSTVRVDQGSVSFRVIEDAPGAVTVITPSGVTEGQRGGFRVTIEDEASRTEALYEQVVVIGAGQELVVDAGFGSRVRAGQSPDPAVALLPAGTPIAPVAGPPLRRPEFEWTPVDRALGYRVEFSATEDFSEMVLVEEADGTPWAPEVLFLPFRVQGLWWRVTAFDRTGFAGLPSDGWYLAFPSGVGP